MHLVYDVGHICPGKGDNAVQRIVHHGLGGGSVAMPQKEGVDTAAAQQFLRNIAAVVYYKRLVFTAKSLKLSFVKCLQFFEDRIHGTTSLLI